MAGDGVASTRERILDATLDVVAVEGLRGMSLEAVAAKAGVSRQTVYRHFGSRAQLIQQVVLREERRLVDYALVRTAGHATLRASLQAGLEACLTEARKHPLIKPLLETEPGELLPYLLGPRQPVLGAAIEGVVEVVAQLVPGLSEADRTVATDAGVRLAISHVISPSSEPDSTVAAQLADLVVTWVEARMAADA